MGGSFHGYVSHNQRVMCFCFFKPKDGGNQAVAVMATFPRWTLRLRDEILHLSHRLMVSSYPTQATQNTYGPMDLWIIDENQAYIYIILYLFGWMAEHTLGSEAVPNDGELKGCVLGVVAWWRWTMHTPLDIIGLHWISEMLREDYSNCLNGDHVWVKLSQTTQICTSPQVGNSCHPKIDCLLWPQLCPVSRWRGSNSWSFFRSIHVSLTTTRRRWRNLWPIRLRKHSKPVATCRKELVKWDGIKIMCRAQRAISMGWR